MAFFLKVIKHYISINLKYVTNLKLFIMNRIYLLALSSFLLFSCTQTPETDTKSEEKINTEHNDLVSAEVVVKDYINLVTNDNPNWVKSAVDNKLIETIINKALDGTKVYSIDDGDTAIMPLSEIQSYMGGSIDTIEVENETGEISEVIMVNKPKISEVEALFFKENWSFNAENFSFKKDIKEYLPVREYYKETENGIVDSSQKVKRLVFKIINDNNSKDFEKVAENVTTAFYFNAETPSSINGLDVNRFVNYLINYTYIDKKDVYDFYDESTKLSYNDASASIGVSTDTLEVELDSGNIEMMEFITEPDAQEFIGVIFVENWYLDKKTLSFKKEVIGLAPIRQTQVLDPAGEYYTRTKIPYLIKL